MSFILKNKVRSEIEVKYNINFDEVKIISDSIKNDYFKNNSTFLTEKFVFETEEFISTKCFERFKKIEEKEFSYVCDISLYRKIERAYELWYLLYDYMNIELLWYKEALKIYDVDYEVLKKIAEIYIRETDELIKEIKLYEMGGKYEDEKDTVKNLCCNRRKM